jgi:hypothetical protein
MQVLLSLYHDYMMAILVLIFFVDFDHTLSFELARSSFSLAAKKKRRRRHKSADQECIIVVTF